jgi:hypothetical protein
MGHRDNEPMGFYVSGLVGIDSQSMVRDRPQRAGLLEQHISMMAKRNLFAPQPPGSQLTQRVYKAPNLTRCKASRFFNKRKDTDSVTSKENLQSVALNAI